MLAQSSIDSDYLISASGRDGFYYQASPYTDHDPKKMEHRAYEAWRQSGLLSKLGIVHYPAVYAKHEIARAFNLPRDAEYWLNMNRPFLLKCCGLIVSIMPGWQTSKGIDQEISYVRMRGKPIYSAYPTEDGLRFERL